MATILKPITLCDVCGAEGTNITTHKFGFKEDMFQVDLCPSDRARFAQTMGAVERRLSRYLKAGTEVTGQKRKSTNVSKPEVRAWANENGYDMPTRGRIPFEVHDAYEKAMQAKSN